MDVDRVKNRREKRMKALGRVERHLPISFSIVGVQKAATSTLYLMLGQHPRVAAGPEKEMRFFIEEKRDWVTPDYSEYVRPARRRARIAGDATPEYLFWPHALERMHRYNPDLRLLATFRDPIERAVSQWSMQRERDPGFPDLPRTIADWAHPEVPTDVPDGLSPFELRRQSLFTRGLYGQQLRRGLEIFPSEQWLTIDFRDTYTRPTDTLDRITDFLDIERFETYPELLHRNQTPDHHTGAAPSTDDVRRLVDLFGPDLEEFAKLSGIDVSGWSTMRVAAGELSIEDFTASLARKVGLAASTG